jgi:hypothetical protein
MTTAATIRPTGPPVPVSVGTGAAEPATPGVAAAVGPDALADGVGPGGVGVGGAEATSEALFVAEADADVAGVGDLVAVAVAVGLGDFDVADGVGEGLATGLAGGAMPGPAAESDRLM